MQKSPWRRVGRLHVATSHKIVVKLLDGLCVFESWRKERKRVC